MKNLYFIKSANSHFCVSIFFNTNRFLRYSFCSLLLYRFSWHLTQKFTKPVIKSCARLVQTSSNHRNKFLKSPFKIILTPTLTEVIEQIAITEFASGDISLYFLFSPYKLHGPSTLYATPLLTLHIDKGYLGLFFVQNKSEYL